MPVELPPVQSFPPHIMLFLGSIYKHSRPYEKYRLIPLSQWSKKWRGRFHTIAVDTLRVLHRPAQGPNVKNVTIRHTASSTSVFAAQAFGKEQNFRYYYGCLVYADLYGETSKTKVYGEVVMLVTAEEFRCDGSKIGEKTRGQNGEDHPVRIVPAPFYMVRYVNDGKYLPGHRTPEIEKQKRLAEKR